MLTRLIAALVCSLAVSPLASAAEISLLSSGALKEIVTELLPQFEKSSGHKVNSTFAGTSAILKQIDAGEVFDLVIVSAPDVDRLSGAGKFRTGSRIDLGKSGVGVAVKAGAPKPDIGSAEAVKRALLNAKSVAYSPGPSGVYVRSLFDKLGVTGEVLPKAKQTAPGARVGQLVAQGEAELGFQQISELVHESGIQYLGPLPADIQYYTIFSSGIMDAAKQPDAARALQAALSAASVAPVYVKNGMDQAR